MKETPAVSKTENPFAVTAGKKAVLLVPFEVAAQEKALELLQEMHPDVTFPDIHSKVKITNLDPSCVLFTAIPVITKITPGQKSLGSKQPVEWAVNVSKPVDCSKYLSLASLDGDRQADFRGLIDAVQLGLSKASSNISPIYTCRVSEDGILTFLNS